MLGNTRISYYSVVEIDDPNYTNFDDRFGLNGTYSYSREPLEANYNVTFPEGLSNVYVDLMVPSPSTATVPPDFYHVDAIEFQLPAAPAGETWTLADIWLTPDPDTNRRPLYEVGMYEPPDHLSAVGPPAVDGDYTGCRLLVEGKASSDIPYGFEDHQKTEFSLKQRQKRRHPPDSPLVGELLDTAKPLNNLDLEVSLQEGWEFTNNDAENSSHNKDALGVKMFGDFYYFDLIRGREYPISGPDVTYQWPGCPPTIYWTIRGGTPYKVYYESYLQGRVHGMVIRSDRSGRSRGVGTVRLERQPAGGGSWVEGSTGSPDVHGRFRLGPALQEDFIYRIGDVGVVWEVASGNLSIIRNDRYSLVNLFGGGALLQSAIDIDWAGGYVHRLAVNDLGQLVSQRLAWPFDANEWSDPVTMSPGDYTVLDPNPTCMHPEIKCLSDGRYYVAYEREEGLFEANSDDGLQTLEWV
ncbi:hypothetical protein LCGC14_1922020 [marine sediment metagenome]|uniref:Uncharacterized protein n=1 Tax=marine sediment metagenome TaxID=412755 RepID=A0A0F9FR85_9ZZZZ